MGGSLKVVRWGVDRQTTHGKQDAIEKSEIERPETAPLPRFTRRRTTTLHRGPPSVMQKNTGGFQRGSVNV